MSDERQGEILAWLNDEQKKADRWTRVNDGGVFRFMLTGPELMRIRRALERPFPVYQEKEWQCRYVFLDSRCCGLKIDHDGGHVATGSLPGLTVAGSVPTEGTATAAESHLNASTGWCSDHGKTPHRRCDTCARALRPATD